MKQLLWRVLFVVICFVLLIALMPPLLHLIGFPINGDVEQIVRICAAGIALIYIIWGPPPFPNT